MLFRSMYLLYYGLVDFFMGFVAGIKAFTAAVLGGIGSLPGAMLGGLLIGHRAPTVFLRQSTAISSELAREGRG